MFLSTVSCGNCCELAVPWQRLGCCLRVVLLLRAAWWGSSVYMSTLHSTHRDPRGFAMPCPAMPMLTPDRVPEFEGDGMDKRETATACFPRGRFGSIATCWVSVDRLKSPVFTSVHVDSSPFASSLTSLFSL